MVDAQFVYRNLWDLDGHPYLGIHFASREIADKQAFAQASHTVLRRRVACVKVMRKTAEEALG